MIATEVFKRGIKPDPLLTITQWADKYRYLPKESSKESGKYRSSRTPWVIEIMDELSPSSPTQKVIAMKPTQMAFTEIGNNFLMAIAHMFQGPALAVYPTDSKARKNSKKRISPSLRSMPCLANIIKPPRTKDSGNTILEKDFPGGSWTFSGSNSPVSARMDSIRYLILDDFDGFEINIGGEGDPSDLFGKRTDSFGSKKKIYINSTPTLKGFSNIQREYEASSQGMWNVPCPHCNEYQYLEWGGKDADFGIKFTRDEDNQIIDIWYVCKHCHSRIDEYQKEEMNARGKYIHKYPNRKVRGFKINSLYSPLGWVSWEQIAEEFLAIKKSKEKLQVWINTRMADVFEEEGDQPDWVILRNRAEPYIVLTVPNGAFFLTLGTDTQDNRLVSVVRGWGRFEESWLIYWGELYGDPDEQDAWIQHDELLNRPYKRADGSALYILSAAVDTGGHKTQAVYNYCRRRAPRVMAIKGASTAGKPVVSRPTNQDVTWKGEKVEKGVQLWTLGTDTIKNTIYGRLNLKSPGPGFYHFPFGVDDEYYEQLTAEKLVTRYVKGFPIPEYVKTRKRNDALDCEQYAYAAAIRAGMAFMNWDKPPSSPAKKSMAKPANNSGIARSSWMSR